MARGSRRSTTRTGNFTRNSLAKFIRVADERLDDYLKRLDAGDVEEDRAGGGARTNNLAEKIAALRDKRGRYAVMLEELEKGGETEMSLTDLGVEAMVVVLAT
jgi:hypothetical protein